MAADLEVVVTPFTTPFAYLRCISCHTGTPSHSVAILGQKMEAAVCDQQECWDAAAEGLRRGR